MTVKYLYHSGFLVELYDVVMIFDYYKGELPVYSAQKKIYVFVSHKHKDHFNLALFSLCDRYENIHFFVGSDVRLSETYLERNGISPAVKAKITHTGKNQTYQFDELTIETLRSTDAGVAFLIGIRDRMIYHAGDLNWWHWAGEAASFNEKMEQDYKKEINRLAGRKVDVAFIPLDPRQEVDYARGMDYFLQTVKAAYVFPMHMWDQYDWIRKYKKEKKQKEEDTMIMEIEYPGEEFSLWNI